MGTSTACVAELLARVLPLLSTPPIRHQWALPRNSVWDQARWLALQALHPTVLVQLLSVMGGPGAGFPQMGGMTPGYASSNMSHSSFGPAAQAAFSGAADNAELHASVVPSLLQ